MDTTRIDALRGARQEYISAARALIIEEFMQLFAKYPELQGAGWLQLGPNNYDGDPSPGHIGDALLKIPNPDNDDELEYLTQWQVDDTYEEDTPSYDALFSEVDALLRKFDPHSDAFQDIFGEYSIKVQIERDGRITTEEYCDY